jgi:predicted nucleotidyltransferase
MKISSPLDKILDSEAKVKILRFLVKTNAQWNGRQIAKEVGVTPATAHKALHSLHKEGAVILRNVGRTHIYNLNGNNYLAAELLKPLFAKEDKVLNSIIAIIKRKIGASDINKDIVSVVLFGSVKLRKDRPTSDIDLAVIARNKKTRKEAENLFEKIDKKISLEFGNTISPYINTESEFRSKHKKGLAIIKNILKANTLVYGKEIQTILWPPRR